MPAPPVDYEDQGARGPSVLTRESDRPQVIRHRPSSARRPHLGFPAVLGIVIVAAIVFPFILIGGAYLYVSSEARVVQADQTDAIVVLGAAQFDGKPSPVLKARLAHAKSLYDSGTAPRIVTVGGKQEGDRFTEAAVGRDWLVAQGVPSQDVIAAKDGNDTLGSLEAVAALAAANGWTSITLDSDPAHMARSRAMANRLGFDVRTNPTRSGDGSQVTSEYLVRETAAYLAFEAFEQWDVPRIVER